MRALPEIDGAGRPLDGQGPLATQETRSLQGRPINPLARAAIAQPLDWNNLGGGARQYWNNTTSLGTNFRAFDQPVGPTLASIVTTLTGPDADGYFTTVAGLSSSAPVAFPASTTLRAVAIESYLTFSTTVNGVTTSMNVAGNAAMKALSTATQPGNLPLIG